VTPAFWQAGEVGMSKAEAEGSEASEDEAYVLGEEGYW